MRRPKAIIFVPRDTDAARWWKVCVEHCQDRGYNVVFIVARWEDVERIKNLHDIDVVVTARQDHLPPDRTPRDEAVDQQAGPMRPRRRRAATSSRIRCGRR